MAERQIKQKPFKIIAATSMTLFSLLAVFMGTYAWFTAVRKVNNDSSAMEVRMIQGCLKQLTIHELVEDDEFIIDNQTKDITGYKFNSTPASTLTVDWNTGRVRYDNQAPSLGRYSLLQKTNPLLLVFTLNEDTTANTVSITATSSQNYTAAQYESMASASGNPLSWVVKYSSKTVSTASLASSDYTIMKNSLSGEGHFANVSDNGTFNSYSQNQTFFSSTSSSSIRHICVVLDYYANAMEYFYMVNLGKSFLNDFENDVPFNIDWVMEI